MFFRLWNNAREAVRLVDLETLSQFSTIFRRSLLCMYSIRYFVNEDRNMLTMLFLIEIAASVVEHCLNEPEPDPKFEHELIPQPNFVGIKFDKLEFIYSVMRALNHHIAEIDQLLLKNNQRLQRIILAHAKNTYTFKSKVLISAIPLSKLVMLDGYAFDIDELNNYFARSAFGVQLNPHTKQAFSFDAINDFRQENSVRTAVMAPQTMFNSTLRKRFSKELTIQTHIPTMKRKSS